MHIMRLMAEPHLCNAKEKRRGRPQDTWQRHTSFEIFSLPCDPFICNFLVDVSDIFISVQGGGKEEVFEQVGGGRLIEK